MKPMISERELALQKRVEDLEQELALVDSALARRPAVADAPNRYTAICRPFDAITRCEQEKAKLVEALEAAKSLIEQYPQMVRRILGSKPVTNVPHLEAEAEAWLEKYAALQQADSGEKGESL